MAGADVNVKAIVLKKTKLGESDLILHLLSSDGAQLRAVAKGARKPKSSFASRLELFSISNLLLAPGKTFYIVKEARLLQANEAIRKDYDLTLAASPMMQIVDKEICEVVENPFYFNLSVKALSIIAENEANTAPLICIAFFLKVFAVAGVRPCFDSCVHCSATFFVKDVKDAKDANAARNFSIHMSVQDGGLVCEDCASKYEDKEHAQLTTMSIHSLMVACEMLCSTLDHVAEMSVATHVRKELLIFCKRWTSAHLHCSLKSLNMMCN